MLKESDMLPEPMHSFFNMAKGRILYVGGKKPGTFPKVWRGQIVIFLHLKAGVATDGAKNIMVLRRIEEELTPIVFNNWYSKTISVCIEAKVGGE